MEEKATRAKRLMLRLKVAKLLHTFMAWKNVAEFEHTVAEANNLLDEIAPIFDKKTGDRNIHDLHKVAGVISQVRVFRHLEPEVLQFLASHATLAVLWDSNELPRNTADRSNFYSVLSGTVKAVVGDSEDPQLRSYVHAAAEQLVKLYGPKEVPAEDAESGLTSRGTFNAEYGVVGNAFGISKVRSRLWRSVMLLIQSDRMDYKGKNASPLGSGGEARKAAALTGGAIATRINGIEPEGPMLASALNKVEEVITAVADVGADVADVLTDASAVQVGKRAQHSGGPTIGTFELWESFSGCHLDCRQESGQADYGSQHIDFPQKVQGAMCVQNSVASLLVITKHAYSKAMHMQMDMLVQKAVDNCCRLPFLRHTPLRELFRLSRYLQEERFSRGDSILKQGKENTSIHFLIEGEVEIVIDLPLTADRKLLVASIEAGQLADRQSHQQPGLMRSSSVRALDGTLVSSSTLTALNYQGPKQRIVLGRRGPGVVLGDDSLREKRMVVSCLALSPEVVTLSITPQRFSMCVDPLTLRLMHKLRQQHSATAEFTGAVADMGARRALLDRCREVMLAESYQHVNLSTSDQNGIGTWKRTDTVLGQFSTFMSLTEGERRVKAEEEAAAAAAVAAKLGGGNMSSNTLAHSPSHSQGANSSRLNSSTRRFPVVGVTAAMFKGVRGGESLAHFIQTVQVVEEQRAASMLKDSKMRKKMAEMDISTELDDRVERKLDITDSSVTMATNRVYTDMVEAAAIACIRVVLLPGQPETAMDALAPVLDDAAVAWSQIAHESELQLVRWRSHEFYLLGCLSMGKGRRPMVRMVADSLLQMEDCFNNIISHNPVPHYSFSAGLALGAIFASYDCGRFMTGITGQALVAAEKLCAEACYTFPTGAIMCSDAVMQATSRTHELRFVASGYQLVKAVQLPFNATFDEVLGHGALEREPISGSNHIVAAKNIQANKSSHFGDSGRWYSLDDGLPATVPVNDSQKSNFDAVPYSNSPPCRRVTLSPLTVISDKSYGSDTDSPSSAASPGNRTNSHGTGHRRSSTLTVGRRVSNHSIGGAAAPAAVTSAPPVKATVRTTFEPRMHLLQNSKKREGLMTKSSMNFRQQLRQELLEVGLRSHSVGELSTTVATVTKSPLPSPWLSFAPTPASTVRGGSLMRGDSYSHEVSTWAMTEVGTSVDRADVSAGCGRMESPNRSGIHSITPYGPGKPMGNVASRQRSAEVLFGTPAAVHAGLTSKAESCASSGRSGSALRAVSPPANYSVPNQALFPDLVTPSMRPFSPRATEGRASVTPNTGNSIGNSMGSNLVESPFKASSRGTTPRDSRQSGGGNNPNLIHSNFGSVPISLSSPRREGLGSAEAGVFTLTGDIPRSASEQASVHLSAGGRRSSVSVLQVDEISGLTRKTIHREAVATWKDLGSVRAAEEYVELLPVGIMNISFSTAGLSRLPSLNRLPFLYSLAASFNNFGVMLSEQLSTISPNLKVLNLSFSQVRELPNDVPQHLPSLTELNLASNLLEKLPESLFSLSCLRVLSIQGNHLTHLHRNLGKASSLEVLYAGHNRLPRLPDVFHRLHSLQLLSVPCNQLVSLPTSVTALSGLLSFSAKGNQIEQLPPGFLTSLTSLTELDLSANMLTLCPQITGNGNARLGNIAPRKECEQRRAASADSVVSTVVDAADEAGAAAGAGAGAGAADQAGAGAGAADKSKAARTPPLDLLAVMKNREATLLPDSGAVKGSDIGSRPTMAMPEEEGGPQFDTPDEGGGLLLPKLLSLGLASNLLHRLPPWLPPSLEQLDASHNRLNQLPDWAAGRLKSLTCLDLCDNKMTFVSRNLSELTGLKLVALEENPCSDVEAKGSTTSAIWVAEWMNGIKFRRRANKMTQAATGGVDWRTKKEPKSA